MALVPAAKIGHIGISEERADLTKRSPNEYYCKLPFDINERDVIVTDIMLATGNRLYTLYARLRKPGTFYKVYVHYRRS